MKPSRSVLLAAAALLVSCSSGGGDALPPVAAPTFSPAAPYDFGAPLTVALATATEGAAIRFTTDGSAPTAASDLYAQPITLTATTTVRAFATHDGMADSAEASATYVHRPVDLVLDNGSIKNALGLSPYVALMLNRFTPEPGAFPFMLRTISVLFEGPKGRPIQLVVLTDGDGDPANGATLARVHPATVLAARAWSVYELPEPVALAGPGDVLVGVVVPASTLVWLDSTSSGSRSWLGEWTTVEAPDPLAFPPNRSFNRLDSSWGNWMIRASN